MTGCPALVFGSAELELRARLLEHPEQLTVVLVESIHVVAGEHSAVGHAGRLLRLVALADPALLGDAVLGHVEHNGPGRTAPTTTRGGSTAVEVGAHQRNAR